MKVYKILIFCIYRVFLSLSIDIKLNALVRLYTSCYFISQCIFLDIYPFIRIHHQGDKYKSIYTRFYNDIGQHHVV